MDNEKILSARLFNIKVKKLLGSVRPNLKFNPPVLIILARMDQFVSDLSEGMTKLKHKYKTKFPSNITTIIVKNKLNEDNFLTYGNSAKDIYLILSDD